MRSAKVQVLRIGGDPERLSSQVVKFQIHNSMSFFSRRFALVKLIPRELFCTPQKWRVNARGILPTAENPRNERFPFAWFNFMRLNPHTRRASQYFHRNDQAHCVLAPLHNAFDALQRPAHYTYAISFGNKRRRLHGNRVVHYAPNGGNFIVVNRCRNFSRANDGMNAGSRKQAYLPFYSTLNEYITGKDGKRDLLLAVAPLTDFH